MMAGNLAPKQWVQGMRDSFSSLSGSPRHLWLIFLVKFLESLAYFSKSLIFAIFLSDEFGMSDTEAGLYFGLVGSLTTVYGFFVGPLIDKLGCRNSLVLGSVLSLVSRIAVGVTTGRLVLWVMAFVVMPIGGCLMIPVMTLAVKGHTNQQNRGFAFGLFYSVMNVGALGSGLMVDALTLMMKEEKYLGLSANRWVFMVGGMCSAATLLICVFFLKDKEGGRVADSQAKFSVSTTVRELLRHPTFWRFVAFTLISVNLKSIFRHLDATFPKYMVREHGKNVAKGTIYAINPFMIIFLVPIVSAVTSNYAPFDCIHFGAYVSASSVFILAASTTIEAAVFWIIVLSLGEAIWSPRFYDYTVSVAPEGKEGTFMALSAAPLFLATMPAGILSGHLLQVYCPEEGRRNSQMMWLIIGLVTASSPLLMTLTQRWVREPMMGREKGHLGGGDDRSGSEGGEGGSEVEMSTLGDRTETGDSGGLHQLHHNNGGEHGAHLRDKEHHKPSDSARDLEGENVRMLSSRDV